MHFGHLRLAIEVYEAIAPARLDFVPCANPPHKSANDFLPFALRYAMLKAATEPRPEFFVNPLESEREDFSYTADTLREYRRNMPGASLYFILGAEDFELLDSWKDWRILPELAELLVVARQGAEDGRFRAAARRLWPEAKEGKSPDGRPAFTAGNSGRLSYLALPRLDINASLIRSRWLEGRSIDYWVPREVTKVLQENCALVKKYWQL